MIISKWLYEQFPISKGRTDIDILRKKNSFISGYLALIVGAVLTLLVQSSSVFTSALTPLVGLGVLELERVYPLTLGSNVGTTGTGLLAAFAASGGRFRPALQVII